MLYYDRIDISEGIDLGDLCNDLYNGSHVLAMLSDIDKQYCYCHY